MSLGEKILLALADKPSSTFVDLMFSTMVTDIAYLTYELQVLEAEGKIDKQYNCVEREGRIPSTYTLKDSL